MRYFFGLLLLLLVFFLASKMISLLIRGKLFEEGAFKRELRESGKTLWLGMRLFVVLWLIYLLIIYFARQS